MEHSREITLVQTAAIIISTIIGVGVLRLPLIAVQAGDTAAPLVTFIAIIVAFIELWIIIKLGSRFPNQSLIEYSEIILGKWLGRLYNLLVIIFFIFLTGFASREFGAVVVTAVLKETPIEVTVIVMLLMAAIITRDTLDTFAYIHNFYVPIILVPGLIIVIVSLKNSNSLYLQPVFGSELSGMLPGILTILALFQGAFILTTIIPVMQKPKKVIKAAIWGIAISGGFYIIIVIAALSVFGPEEIKKTMWPVLELARATSIPGNMLQRLDVVFLAIWVTAVFTTIFSSYMFTVYSLRQLCRLRDHKMFSFFLLPMIFMVAMIPQDTLQMYGIIENVGRIGLIITIVFPVLLLIIVHIRKIPRK